MTMLRYLTLALAAAAILWPAEPPQASAGLAGSGWRIVEVDGAKAADVGTLQFAGDKLTGQAACNRFFATFAERSGKLTIGPIGATRRFCQGKMELERATLTALAKAWTYARDGDRLVLLADAGEAVLALEPVR